MKTNLQILITTICFLLTGNVLQAQLACSYNTIDCNCIEIFADGVSPPYSYTWSNGNTTQFDCNLPSNAYTVTVTDSDGNSCFVEIDVFEIPPVSLFIDGPDCVSPGQNAFYLILNVTGGGNFGGEITWYFEGNIINDPSDISEPGTYSVIYYDIESCEEYSLEHEVLPCENCSPSISILQGAICESSADSLANVCHKVCTNTPVVYGAEDVEQQEVEWTVSGSDDYDINGNQVSVTWGDAGFGEVSFVVEDSTAGSSVFPLQVFADVTYNDLGGSSLVFYISEGVPPYAYTIIDAGNTVLGEGTTSNNLNYYNFNLPAEPVSSIQVTDASGLSFVLNILFNPCFFGYPSSSFVPTEIVHTTDCNTCDGVISLTDIFPGTEYILDGGGTVITNENPTFSNLCSGLYNVTAVSSQDSCFRSMSVITIYCNEDSTSSCTGSASTCVEIVEDPIAEIGSDPPAISEVIEICKGESIQFENLSEGAATIIWDFGDLTNSVLPSPEHTYLQAGTYQMNLIARNGCYCADTAFLTVNVLDLEIVDIKCKGTVCEGETVTYETEASCGSYNWTVSSSGTILDGGGTSDNFVTVQWDVGPEGLVALEVNGCSPALCGTAAEVTIPIITNNTPITGKTDVCTGEIAQYSITDFGGSDMFWTVSSFGTILEGQGTSTITVEWFGTSANNPQFVQVDYENCYLGCGGSSTLNITILKEFYARGPIEVCQNETALYEGIEAILDIGVSTNFEVFDASGTSLLTVGPALTAFIDWTYPAGIYTVRAVPGSPTAFCNAENEIRVEILELPVLPINILGIDPICVGNTYTYEAVGLGGHQFHWLINNGGVVTEDYGDRVNVVWGNVPPYELELSQISPTGLNCESGSISRTFSAISTLSLTGNNNVCKEEVAVYTADNYENITYDWTITPNTAGDIISGKGTSIIEVLWQSPGTGTLEVNACGLMASSNVTIHPYPTFTAQYPANVCPEETGLVGTTPTFAAYSWQTEGGIEVASTPNPQLSDGYYNVIVTDGNGCTQNELFTINALAIASLTISSHQDAIICPGNNFTIVASDIESGFDYQWFLDGVPIGTNSSTLIANQAGTYYVEAIGVNGCLSISNELTFVTCASVGGTCVGGVCTISGPPGPPLPGCTPNGSISFQAIQTNDCSIYNFQNTSINFIAGTQQWYIENNATGLYQQVLDVNPTYTFPCLGYYTVYLFGEIAGTPTNCLSFQRQDIAIQLASDYNYTSACIGLPVTFEADASFLPGEIGSITAYDWIFGDPSSGTNQASGSNASHIFSGNGDFQVTLTVTADNGCQTSNTQLVSVLDNPDIDFDLPAINCQATSLNFVAINNDANVTDLDWNFGDPASGESNTATQNNTYHVYESPGTYTVSLTSTNIFGCEDTHTETVPIEPNPLSGIISLSGTSPICEGESLDLTAPAGGTIWEWSTAEISETITVTEEGEYSVTIYNDDGCSYIPPGVVIEVLPVPLGTIRAVEYDEYGQPIAVFDDMYTICEGEEVFLLAESNSNNTFIWSNSESEQEISFTEEKGNLLTEGTYVFTVEITDSESGCSIVTNPFEVLVNPTPNDATVSSVPDGIICDGTAATISIDNPDASLSYVWNTGEVGNSIQAFAAGEYFVRVVNSFGCQGESNRIAIENAPDINKIPSGCFTRCNPDTMCLPQIPNIVNYQWYLDGNPIAGPGGNIGDIITTASGDYTLEMTDAFGCVALSEEISLDLQDAFGDIIGNVYFDVNENGVIDVGDTLVSNIEVYLMENGIQINATNSDNTGIYGFPLIPSTDYVLQIDENNLPPGWGVYDNDRNLTLEGCDDEEQSDWLLYFTCVASSAPLTLYSCDGATVDYEGLALDVGETDSVTYTSQLGCDSTVVVTVEEINSSSLSYTEGLCAGETIEIEGITLAIGDEETFVYTNTLGCDSTVLVTVVEIPSSSSTTVFSVCKGETMEIGGETLEEGNVGSITTTNAGGCDSVINYTVIAYPDFSYGLSTVSAICADATDGEIVVENVIGSNGYTYSIDEIIYQNAPIFTGLSPDTYIVNVKDENDCVEEESITIEARPSLEIAVRDAQIDCGEPGIVLEPIPIYPEPENLIWEWSDGSTGTDYYAETAGTYVLKVSSDCEVVERSIIVNWEALDDKSVFYVPNSFSPNGDGINDKFRSMANQDLEAVLSYDLKVFNRWGDMVFETKEYSVGWEGNFSGESADVEVFVYILEARVIICGQEIKEEQAGDVTIVR